MQLNPQQLSHILAVWPVARLASIGAHEQPHLVPIVFVCVDGVIYSPVDGKRKRDGALQRLRNVARRASVSILLDHYDVDWRRLWWLRIDVKALSNRPSAVQRLISRGSPKRYAPNIRNIDRSTCITTRRRCCAWPRAVTLRGRRNRSSGS